MSWNKLRKEKGRWVTCKPQPDPAPKGVSISSEHVKDDETIERIAINGEIKHELHCFNGQQRDQARAKAVECCAELKK